MATGDETVVAYSEDVEEEKDGNIFDFLFPEQGAGLLDAATDVATAAVAKPETKTTTVVQGVSQQTLLLAAGGLVALILIMRR